MAGGTTAKEMRKRLDIVQRAMEEHGWNPRLKRKLADQWGVSDRTIYQYRKRVLEEMAEDHQGVDFFERRAEFLNRLGAHQRAAAKRNCWGPVSGMMGIEAKVLGLDKPLNAPLLATQEATVYCDTCESDVFAQPCSHVLEEALAEALEREAATRH